MQMDKSKLAEDMLMYRAIQNISQQELADKCNLSRDIIIKAEKGVANLRTTTYLKIKNVIEGSVKNEE